MLAVFCPTCGGNHEAVSDCLFALDDRFGDRLRLGLTSAWQPLQQTVICFDCGTVLAVAVGAQSTMCKKCSAHLDLCDYDIHTTVYRRFRTKGRLSITEKGCLHGTDVVVGNAILKGKFVGKLQVEGALSLYSSAEVKGEFSADKLVIPAGEHVRWPFPLEVRAAEILGELTADIRAATSVVLRQSARLFGNIHALHLVVEKGAVFVGSAFTGPANARALAR
jgi:cytoskeletal protein CcmA (bactofilin family)